MEAEHLEAGFVYKDNVGWQQIEIQESEVYRYLGYRGENIKQQIQEDERVKKLVTAVIQELHQVLIPQVVYAEYPIHLEADDWIDLGFARTKSYNLSRNLQNCDKIVLFAATIGPRVDQLIQKNSRINPLKGVIMQAAGAMFIESFCDLLNQQWNNKNKEDGYVARPRFSPGYGDLSLNLQKNIFEALSCPQRIGLTLMDTLIMAPGKSVTAMIGYQRTNPESANEHKKMQNIEPNTDQNIDQNTNQNAEQCTDQILNHNCNECTLKDCEFRQKGTITK